MSSDEDDYMSDNFLAKCIPQDVRPGLKMSHSSKRHHDVEKKRDEKLEREADMKRNKKSKKQVEETARNEGLEKSLDESNKGFAMLQKMGYKAGESLGKTKSGLVEPIKVEVKANRLGLGREAAMKRIAETKAEFRQRHQEMRKRAAEKHREISAQEFRQGLSKRNKAKQVDNDLYKSQKTCHQLDVEKGFKEPAETWFWPSQTLITDEAEDIDDQTKRQEVPCKDDNDSDSDEENITEVTAAEPPAESNEDRLEFSPDEMLQILTGYLRSQYFYCLWCGITFNSEEEIASSCPGPAKDDHDD